MKSVYYVIAVVVFLLGAFFVITYASGYKVDITNRNLMQTGMVVAEAEGEAAIYLNDIEIGKGDQTIRNLMPGAYSLSIKRDGYHDWNKSFELEPGEAEIINNAILFKLEPVVEEYKIDQSDFFTKLADKDAVQVSSNEIYQNSNFVTRFSNEPKGVCWYSDRRYIAFTYDNSLKLIQIDGSNEINLLEKDSDSPVVFVNSGRSVIYQNKGKVYRAQIR